MSNFSHYSEETPQFFTIFLPEGCSEHIKIPPAFVNKYLNGACPSSNKLRVVNYKRKRVWQVGITKVGEHFFFEKGWPQFVKDNSLERGDFLIFYLDENSEYDVCIFGVNQCPKVFPSIAPTEQPINQAKVEPHHDVATETPAFLHVIKSSYMRNGELYIPMKFWRTYIPANATSVQLQHDASSWVVSLKIRKAGKGHSVMLGSGWDKFATDNALEEGDNCRFELINRDELVFSVAITKRNIGV